MEPIQSKKKRRKSALNHEINERPLRAKERAKKQSANDLNCVSLTLQLCYTRGGGLDAHATSAEFNSSQRARLILHAGQSNQPGRESNTQHKHQIMNPNRRAHVHN